MLQSKPTTFIFSVARYPPDYVHPKRPCWPHACRSSLYWDRSDPLILVWFECRIPPPINGSQTSAGETARNRFDLVLAQNFRYPLRLLGPGHLAEIADLFFQNMLLQKQDGAQRLVLGRSGDMLVHRQISQEFRDFLLSHLGGMARL